MSELPYVLGVDCSSRKSTVFDGVEFSFRDPDQLDQLLGEVDGNRRALICWDAPLTGPPTSESVSDDPGAYSMRPIERFFNRARKHAANEVGRLPRRPPEGINTRHYSGMSHWSVTQALTGHPRIGRWHCPGRFPVITSKDELSRPGTRLIEVHPALALWLWLADELDPNDEAYRYKSGTVEENEHRTGQLIEALLKRLSDIGVDEALRPTALESGEESSGIRGSHDRLDAYVAWLLGQLFEAGSCQVRLVGDAESGAMLLPNKHQILKSWDD